MLFANRNTRFRIQNRIVLATFTKALEAKKTTRDVAFLVDTESAVRKNAQATFCVTSVFSFGSSIVTMEIDDFVFNEREIVPYYPLPALYHKRQHRGVEPFGPKAWTYGMLSVGSL